MSLKKQPKVVNVVHQQYPWAKMVDMQDQNGDERQEEKGRSRTIRRCLARWRRLRFRRQTKVERGKRMADIDEEDEEARHRKTECLEAVTGNDENHHRRG